MSYEESIGNFVTTQLAAMADLGDNYQVVRFLSESGFRKAYLCEDIRADDQCVVKVGGLVSHVEHMSTNWIGL